LDCIWLVNDDGKYKQTIDHEFLASHFEIDNVARDRSLYGTGRPKMGPIAEKIGGA